MFDDDLINIYSKIYIYNQYISTDDTIKIIKHKICCGYEKSEYFDKGASYFIPSRLYLWSNYSYSDLTDTIKYDKVMIGQKWTKRTEILELDVEPNENLIRSLPFSNNRVIPDNSTDIITYEDIIDNEILIDFEFSF